MILEIFGEGLGYIRSRPVKNIIQILTELFYQGGNVITTVFLVCETCICGKAKEKTDIKKEKKKTTIYKFITTVSDLGNLYSFFENAKEKIHNFLYTVCFGPCYNVWINPDYPDIVKSG